MTLKEYIKLVQSKEYQQRVKELEKEGLTHSDAQAVADVEFDAIIKKGE